MIAVFFIKHLPYLLPILKELPLYQFTVELDKTTIMQQGSPVLVRLVPASGILLAVGLVWRDDVLNKVHVLLSLLDKLAQILASE